MEALALLLFGSLFLALALPHRDTADDDPDPQATLTGDDGDNSLTGDDGLDLILGLAGNDTLQGAGGADDLDGSTGHDQLFGGAGDDRLFGGTGRNQLHGDEGNDLLDAMLGDSFLDGGAGDDTLIASGPSHLIGNAGNDTFQLDVDGLFDYPVFADFTPGQDRLEIHYTPVPGSEPEIFLNPDASTNGANSYLEMNGQIIGYVMGEFGLGAGDIVLVPKA